MPNLIKSLPPKKFQQLLLNWFDEHGRKHLPWQKNKTPYRVWLSEIMLQQTQVKTVIPYYKRFLERFPTLKTLAAASEDEVLHLWTGLGYYSRARNLHRSAQKIMADFGGKFPKTVADLQTLPGIGLSTAGAIVSIAFDTRAPILDGNVKRVLSRLHNIQEVISSKEVEALLWQLAEKYAPLTRTADYTQAIMDIGATICVRGQPFCAKCPFQKYCKAYEHHTAALLPLKKMVRALPVRISTLLIIKKNQQIYLQRRGKPGVWAGLWCFPELKEAPNIKNITQFCSEALALAAPNIKNLPSFRHTFTHYHLDIFPILIEIKKMSSKMAPDKQQMWYHLSDPAKIGLPKPIQTILQGLL